MNTYQRIWNKLQTDGVVKIVCPYTSYCTLRVALYKLKSKFDTEMLILLEDEYVPQVMQATFLREKELATFTLADKEPKTNNYKILDNELDDEGT